MGFFSDLLDEVDGASNSQSANPSVDPSSLDTGSVDPAQLGIFNSLDSVNAGIQQVVEDAGPITSPQDFQKMLAEASSNIDAQTVANQDAALAQMGAQVAKDANKPDATTQLGTTSTDGINITGDGSPKNPWKINAMNYAGADTQTAANNIAKLLVDANAQGKNVSVLVAPGSELERAVDTAYKDLTAAAGQTKTAIQSLQEMYGNNPALKQLTSAIERNQAGTAALKSATAAATEARKAEETKVILGQEALLAAKKDALDATQKTADIKATLALGPAEFAAAMAAKHGGMYEKISDRMISATNEIIKSGEELKRPFSFSQDGFNVFGKIRGELEATNTRAVATNDLTLLSKVIAETRTIYNDQLSMREKSISATPALNEAQKNELAARAKYELAAEGSKIDGARAKLVTSNAEANVKAAEQDLNNMVRFDTLLTNGIQRLQSQEDRNSNAALRTAQIGEINATKEERARLAVERERQVAANKVTEDNSIRQVADRLGLKLESGKQYTDATLEKDFGKDRATFIRKVFGGAGEGVNIALDPSPAKAIEKARGLNIPIFNAGVERFDEYANSAEFKSVKKMAESQILNSRAIPAEKAEMESKLERTLFLSSQDNINSPNNPYRGDSRYVTVGLEPRIADRLSAKDKLELDSLKGNTFFSTYLPAVVDPARKDNPTDIDIISAASKYAKENNDGKMGITEMANTLSQYYTLQAKINNSVYNYSTFGLPVQQKYGIELSAKEMGFFGEGNIKLPAKSFDLMSPQSTQQLLMSIQRASTLAYAKRTGQ